MTEATRSLWSSLRSDTARNAIVVAAVIWLFSGQGFRYLLGIPAYTVLTVVLFAAVIIAFPVSPKKWRVPTLLIGYLGLATLSIIWSSTPAISALAVIVLIATTYVSIVTVRGTSAAQFMRLLHRGMQLNIVIGLVFELIVATVIRKPIYPLFNELGRHAEDAVKVDYSYWSDNLLFEGGPIQGFVGNRNPFGAIALLALITGAIVLVERLVRPLDAGITIVTSLAVLALTLSATVTVSLVYLAGVAALALLIRTVPIRAKKALSWTVLALSAAVIVVTLKYREFIFALFSRDSDLTNRTLIWSEVIPLANERPEGWGFVSYWPVWREPYAGIIERSERYSATHAHNAFVDIWLQLGLIGVVLILGIVLLTFGSAWRLIERANRGDSFLPLGWVLLTVTLVLQALTESRLIVEGHWFLLVALFCSAPAVFRLTIVDPDLVRSGSSARSEKTMLELSARSAKGNGNDSARQDLPNYPRL